MRRLPRAHLRGHLVVSLAVTALVGLSACGAVTDAVNDPVTADTASLPSAAGATEPATTEPATTEPATTAVPATDAPTTPVPTTDAPTTAAPTTVPTTTAAPSTSGPADGERPESPKRKRKTTTTTTLPAPLRPVAPPDAPFVAVGQASGDETGRIQQRLLDLGYWHAGVDGSYGHTTTQAVMAFQKYMGLDASGAVDQPTADALTSVSERPHGLSTAGDLIEVDKQRQLLFVIRNGLTELVLNTSTGNGEEYTEEDKNTPGEMITGVSLTPNGLYRVDRERPEGWWEGDLGEIYRPKYFRGGIAVHGSNSIPNYPASHGCVRVSVPAMDMFWQFDIMPMWSTVWVHEGL